MIVAYEESLGLKSKEMVWSPIKEEDFSHPEMLKKEGTKTSCPSSQRESPDYTLHLDGAGCDIGQMSYEAPLPHGNQVEGSLCSLHP